MWLPFSRYISATPFRARLMDSVPPEVKTISFGSRAPISLASCPRPRSTAPSASHPNGWFRLAGWPNFSVKYGSIASSTRGSTGVVDWASMKIGNFTAISNGLLRPDREELGNVRARQLGQAHRVQHLSDRRLQFLDRSSQVAPLHLRTGRVVLVALDDPDRTLECPDHLADRDGRGPAGQNVTALRPVLTGDQPLLRQSLQNFREEFRGNSELLRDPLCTHRADGLIHGDVVDRHQAI